MEIVQSAVVTGTTVKITVYRVSVFGTERWDAEILTGYVLGDPTAEILANAETYHTVSEAEARTIANKWWTEIVRLRDARKTRMVVNPAVDQWDPFQDHQNRRVAEVAETMATEGFSARPEVEISEGFWNLGERIFKVQRSQTSGHLYVKELTESGWSYLPGGMRVLKGQAVPLTAEVAEKYGHLYGVCCLCGRTLTNEESIERGYRPGVCR